MTKNIKLIEQTILARQFRIFTLINARLLTISTKEQLQNQQIGATVQNTQYKDSKMQPITKTENEDTSSTQGYQNFTYQLRGVKREYMRPLTHI